MFYNDVKGYMSPSALAQWKQTRAGFVKSYFEGERSPETAAMKGGTTIHKLIELEMLPAKHVFGVNEEEIKVQVPGTGFYFLGRPDSREAKAKKGVVRFVDYKSGKANDWEKKLPTDIKMRATAWLVWMVTGQPDTVVGSIEFIQTTWDPDAKEVIPLEGEESKIIEHIYRYEDLEEFTHIIIKTMGEVNDFYEKWLNASGDFMQEEDTAEYIALQNKIDKLVEKQDEVKERIMMQMEFGGLFNHKMDAGTFYITERKQYSIPESLTVKVGRKKYTLKDISEINTAAKVAESNYKLGSDPVSTSTSLGFRKTKPKKK